MYKLLQLEMEKRHVKGCMIKWAKNFGYDIYSIHESMGKDGIKRTEIHILITYRPTYMLVQF